MRTRTRRSGCSSWARVVSSVLAAVSVTLALPAPAPASDLSRQSEAAERSLRDSAPRLLSDDPAIRFAAETVVLDAGPECVRTVALEFEMPIRRRLFELVPTIGVSGVDSADLVPFDVGSIESGEPVPGIRFFEVAPSREASHLAPIAAERKGRLYRLTFANSGHFIRPRTPDEAERLTLFLSPGAIVVSEARYSAALSIAERFGIPRIDGGGDDDAESPWTERCSAVPPPSFGTSAAREGDELVSRALLYFGANNLRHLVCRFDSAGGCRVEKLEMIRGPLLSYSVHKDGKGPVAPPQDLARARSFQRALMEAMRSE